MHPFTITDQFIDDTLTTALEGGINYWADSATPDHWPDGCHYASEALTRGATLAIVESDEDKTHILTRAMFEKGVRAFCKQRHTTPARLEDEVPDASDADAIVQLAIFGDIIYG